MDKLTNIIESILFASGNSVPLALLSEKLGVSTAKVKESIEELKAKYAGERGIHLLTFNNKAQFATNPAYKEEVASVLNSIKEKEFTKTILETAAIIAYKQPITKGELEEIRRVNSDYAVKTLLELKMIEPCGRKDAIGKPILYATTDNFLKRFKIDSLDELPDYETLMASIAELDEKSQESYLYNSNRDSDQLEEEQMRENTPFEEEAKADNSDLPDFLDGVDPNDVIRIE